MVDQLYVRGRLARMARFTGAVAVAALVSFGSMAGAQAKDPVVFAAASLKNALDAINAQWKGEASKQATVSYAASSALAKQIESGAPADIFMSADLDWMDYLAKKDLIKSDTRVTLLGNRIVLIAPKDSPVKVEIGQGFDLAKALGDGRLAMGDTASVPAGKYGKAALEKLGAWAGVEKKVAQAESVRAALLLVSRGEAPLGIVYATDAAADPQVKIVGTFPESSHPPILYPIALTKDSSNPEAAEFLAYLQSPKAKPLFEKEGFTVMGKSATQ
jgi:molybdate transport system substrate-binding protein